MKRLILAALLLAGCGADESNSRRTLESSGYTEISITGWAPLTCGKDDTFSTGFTAKNPQGRRVSGVVCCGLVFKGCTVRF